MNITQQNLSLIHICVAGAGTMQAIKKSQSAVNKYAAQAKHKISSQTEYVKELDKLVD